MWRLILCVGFAVVTVAQQTDPDSRAIYRAVMSQYVKGESKDIALRLNVANQTTPVTAEELHTSCQTKPFVPDAATLGTSHSLSAEDFRDLPVALVDPKKQNKKVKERDPSKTIREGKSVEDALREAFQSALFTLSDVVFDKEREHAAVQYSFHCGGLCGNGATLIFHKTANGWEQDNKLLCSFWQA